MAETTTEVREPLVEALVTAQHNLDRTRYEGEHAHRRAEMEGKRAAARAALEEEFRQLREQLAGERDRCAERVEGLRCIGATDSVSHYNDAIADAARAIREG